VIPAFARRNLLFFWLAAISVYLAVIDPGISAPESTPNFNEIDVRRINVREPDGTLRMVISNTEDAPGAIARGKEHPHPSRQSAGMLFYNDEGTENGGLIFGGGKEGRTVSSYGHLSFDQYEQDQVIVLEQTEDSGKRFAGLAINDVPEASLPFDLLDRANTRAGSKALNEAMSAIGHSNQRIYIGKTPDHESIVLLRDINGLTRLQLKVAADGTATIDFLDTDGKVVKHIAADDAP